MRAVLLAATLVPAAACDDAARPADACALETHPDFRTARQTRRLALP